MQTTRATWQGGQIVSLEPIDGPDGNEQRIEAKALPVLANWLTLVDHFERPPHSEELTASEVVVRQQMAATADMDTV